MLLTAFYISYESGIKTFQLRFINNRLKDTLNMTLSEIPY